MSTEESNVVDIDSKETKETQLRVDRAIKIAKDCLKGIQRQCKISKVQGEKIPHLLEQMSLAYANALSHYNTFKTLEQDGYTWEQAKANAFELMRITLDHIEQRFNPKPEIIVETKNS